MLGKMDREKVIYSNQFITQLTEILLELGPMQKLQQKVFTIFR